MMEFCILGPLEVRDAHGPVRLGGPKQRALLALLLIHDGEVVPTDRLVDELWPERPPPTAVKTVQMYISQLRRVLADGVLTTHGRGYRLELRSVELDARRFEEGVRRAAAEEHPKRALELLRDALALWRGPALADVAYESFAAEEISRLEELRLAAVEDRIELELKLRRAEELVPELQALVASHPLRERPRAQLMLALYRSGRQPEALETYRDLRQRLDHELGLEPSRALRELEAAILRQDRTLDPPAALVRRPLQARQRGSRRLLVLGGLVLALAALGALLASLGGRREASLASVGANSVAVVEPENGAIVGAVPVGSEPGVMALAGGQLWVANGGDRTLSAIDTRSLRPLQTIGLTAVPYSIAADPRTLWLSTGYDGTISRLDIGDGLLSAPFRPQPGATGRLPLATGFGSLWVGSQDDVVTRLDPATHAVLATMRGIDSPDALAAGAGAVWVLPATRRMVVMIDPRLDRVVAMIPIGDYGKGVAVAEGAVWVLGDRRLWRIDPRTRFVTAQIALRTPSTSIAGGEGAVWVSGGTDGTVARIDPRTNTVVQTISVGRPVSNVIAGAGSVWISVR